MIKPIKSRGNNPSEFHLYVYRRIEGWINRRGIDAKLAYAPVISSVRSNRKITPDIILEIPNKPKITTKDIIDGRYMLDGAHEDWINHISEFCTSLTLVFDVTMLNPVNDPNKWNEKIDGVKRYKEVVKEDEKFYYVSSVIVTKWGWDQSLDHGIDRGVHIIAVNYIDRFLDSAIEASKYYETDDAFEKILHSKYNTCTMCGKDNNQLEYMRVYYCSQSNEFEGCFTREVIDKFTSFEEVDDNQPPAEVISFCDSCSERYVHCDGLSSRMDVVCWNCGNTLRGDLLNPCSLAIHTNFCEDCEFCEKPHKCKNYNNLVKKGKLFVVSNKQNTKLKKNE